MKVIQRSETRSFAFSIMPVTFYAWTKYCDDDPRISGKLDSTRFNRNEGAEVLYLLNELTFQWNLKYDVSVLKMERLIRINLPKHLVQQKTVAEWIRKNWDRFE